MRRFRAPFATFCLLTATLLHLCTSATAGTSPVCAGTTVQGPWYSFVLPEGMRLNADADGAKIGDSIWVESGEGRDQIRFFLFAPRHGGTPYQSFVGSTQVTNLIHFQNENGVQQKYAVAYEDGSTGLFEGNSQRITGVRVYDKPLGAEGYKHFQCFIGSIENYAQ